MELVSVIVPIYNAEEYLEECIQSVINQTYQNLDIILVNDGSTDKSIDICYKYSDSDKRVRVINQANSGLRSAIKTGVNNSFGDYLFFIDSDDWIDVNTISLMIKSMIKYNVDCVRCGYEKVGLKSIIKPLTVKERIFSKEDIQSEILNEYFEISGNIYKNWSNSRVDKMYKKSIFLKILDEMEEKISIGEDTETNLRYLHKCNRIMSISSYLYKVRVTDSSMSRGYNIKMRTAYDMMIQMIKKIAIQYGYEGKAVSKIVDVCYVNMIYETIFSNQLSIMNKAKIIVELNSKINNKRNIMKMIKKIIYDILMKKRNK